MEDIQHQGIAAFNPDPSGYQVFRNVKDFGAKGDGSSDDTAAIQSAISSGNRCGPGNCNSSTTTPAVVYFPAGTYMISAPVTDYYYTQLIGNPNCLPVLKATSSFQLSPGKLAMIEDDPYESTGAQDWAPVNIFNRQIRNFVFDTTAVAAANSVTAIHWATAQATSLQNIIFQMSTAPGNQHQGIFMESGSGGFLNDLIFNGGATGAAFGNQQFTMRNLTFNQCQTAITQIWNWGWTYQGITINNCQTGLNMSAGGEGDQQVGSVIMIDSSISNTPVAIATSHDSSSLPATGGSLILENVQLNNVQTAVQGPGSVSLAGSSGATTIAAWGQGHAYTPNGPNNFQGTFSPNNRPGSLLNGNNFYTRSKPQYEGLPVSSFISARASGAKGDGNTDDTQALAAAISSAASQNKVLYLDHGNYKVTNTIAVPAGAKIVGETYSVIMSSGGFFSDMNNPQPVLRIGQSGDSGSVELSDFIVATQGAQAGATLMEYNLASPANNPSGLWDVHTRIGGFAGSNLQVAQCVKNPSSTTPNPNCIGAYMSMHVTKQSSGLYMENTWFWVADHDIDDPQLTQTTIYAGRGLLDESAGPVWLYGTAIEHHVMYEYQFSNAQNVFAGQIQTETAYYQPNPPAPAPFTTVASLNDPIFSGGPAPNSLPNITVPFNATAHTKRQSTGQNEGWGLRIVDSSNILIYGAGHYSFFINWDVSCSDPNSTSSCQSRIVSLEGALSNVNIYNLNTVKTVNMITQNGNDIALAADNANSYADTIARFSSG